MFEMIDYTKCITNLACSVLKEFGVEPSHNTFAMADEVMKEGYDNIVLILLDGMGMSILEKNADEKGFLCSHLYGEFQSVYLPTTVSSTTSALSGLNPSEHAWLGWDCYYPEIDKNVTVFLNTLTSSEEPAADYPVAYKLRPYKNVIEQIKEAGGDAYLVAPFAAPYTRIFEEQTEAVFELCKKPGKKYIYCYNPQPDGIMHKTGTTSKESKEALRALEKEIEDLCRKLNGLETRTLVMITADHGQTDPKGVCLLDYPDIIDCLTRMPSLEPRTLNLFVKQDSVDVFPEIFNRHFADKFRLYTKKQVLEGKLFGPGKEHAKFRDMLGDYIAIAVSDLAIYFTYEDLQKQKGFHGGMTSEEIRIPFIKIDCKKDVIH